MDNQCPKKYPYIVIPIKFMKRIIRSKSIRYASILSVAVIATLFALPSFTKNDDPATITLNSVKVTGGIQAPTSMAFPAANKAWITEQTGKVRLIKDGKLTDVVVIDLRNEGC
jgi:hypothetical protein